MGMYELEEAGFDLMKEFCPFEEKEVDQWETLCEENFPEYKKQITALLGGAAKELFYVPKKGRRKAYAEKRKASFHHLSEKEKKTRRYMKGWDVRHLDKFPRWNLEKGTVHNVRNSIKAKDALMDDQNLTREQAFNYGQQCADLWESKEKFLSAKEEEENRKFFLDWDWALAQEKAQKAFAEYQHLQEIADQLEEKWLYCNDNIAAIEKAIQSIDSYLEGR